MISLDFSSACHFSSISSRSISFPPSMDQEVPRDIYHGRQDALEQGPNDIKHISNEPGDDELDGEGIGAAALEVLDDLGREDDDCKTESAYLPRTVVMGGMTGEKHDEPQQAMDIELEDGQWQHTQGKVREIEGCLSLLVKGKNSITYPQIPDIASTSRWKVSAGGASILGDKINGRYSKRIRRRLPRSMYASVSLYL